KGTQAERLTEDFNLPYFATGNILRAAVEEGTELGRKAKEFMDAGELVPDDVIIGVILERVQGDDARDGFLLDGFPRTIPQAEALDQALSELDRSLTAVLLVDVPDEEVIRRLSGRRVSVKTGRVYHVEFDPPKHEDRCDVDGSRLIQRDDDKPETIKNRLEVYHTTTEPLVGYYDERDLLRRFDGTRNPTEVHDHIRATVATLRLEDEL
ncbi:MAG: adenylate kinase, partial [Solirubrobacteraceae bacterium]|nr:adenylate kinase [Solirubrobacteraceae bacterium]